MIQSVWLLALAAALAITTACSKEEPPAPTQSVEQAASTNQAPAETSQAPAPMAQQAMTTEAPDGEAIYKKTCFACHDTGLAGAPKLGDQDAWAEHLAEGLDHLVQVAIQGEGAMPPRGGNPALTDEDIRAAVSYMLDQAR